MIGGVLVAIAIAIALPMSFFVLGAIFSAIIGWLLNVGTPEPPVR